jgi:hypothetical protein
MREPEEDSMYWVPHPRRQQTKENRPNPPLPHDHSKGLWHWTWIHAYRVRREKRIYMSAEYRCATEGCGFRQAVERGDRSLLCGSEPKPGCR